MWENILTKEKYEKIFFYVFFIFFKYIKFKSIGLRNELVCVWNGVKIFKIPTENYICNEAINTSFTISHLLTQNQLLLPRTKHTLYMACLNNAYFKLMQNNLCKINKFLC